MGGLKDILTETKQLIGEERELTFLTQHQGGRTPESYKYPIARIYEKGSNLVFLLGDPGADGVPWDMYIMFDKNIYHALDLFSKQGFDVEKESVWVNPDDHQELEDKLLKILKQHVVQGKAEDMSYEGHPNWSEKLAKKYDSLLPDDVEKPFLAGRTSLKPISQPKIPITQDDIEQLKSNSVLIKLNKQDPQQYQLFIEFIEQRKGFGWDKEFIEKLVIPNVEALTSKRWQGDLAEMRRVPVKSLGLLQSVDGKLDLSFSQTLESLGQLQTVEGSLDLSHVAKLKDLGRLRTVGSYLSLTYSSIKSLGQLESVGGDLQLDYSSVVDLGRLRYVGRDLYLRNSTIAETRTEEQIRQQVQIEGRVHL